MKMHTAMRIESQMSHCKKNGDTNPAKSELSAFSEVLFWSGGASGCASSKKSDTRLLSKKFEIALYIHVHCTMYILTHTLYTT